MQAPDTLLRQHGAKTSPLLQTDPRLKLLLAAGFGLQAWYGGWPALLCVALFVLPALFFVAGRDRLRWKTLALGFGFVVFWTLAAAALGLWEGRAPVESLAHALLLGGRLFVLLMAGLVLALASSARQLGLGLSWLLRPVLGAKAWQVALALALMVQFLPRTLETLLQVRRMDSLRSPERRLWQRWAHMAETVLRVLSQNAWKQTVALAARGLDSPESWQAAFAPQPISWTVGLGVLLICTGAMAL